MCMWLTPSSMCRNDASIGLSRSVVMALPRRRALSAACSLPLWSRGRTRSRSGGERDRHLAGVDVNAAAAEVDGGGPVAGNVKHAVGPRAEAGVGKQNAHRGHVVQGQA